jgi:hypothetical protein
MVMKLLAKTAEERYQSTVGLDADLRRCLAQWESDGHIDSFPLGEHDVPDRLLIAEKLYGRKSEIDVLLASFDRVVATGRLRLWWSPARRYLAFHYIEGEARWRTAYATMHSPGPWNWTA